MCLILVSYKQHAEYPLIVAANRDEFYRRKAATLDWWGNGAILSGRDLGYQTLAGSMLQALGLSKPTDSGTWLGVNRRGRFAGVTNFREPGKESKTARSRGLLIRRYLEDAVTTEEFSAELDRTRADYNGFNLLFGTPNELFYYSNRDGLPARAMEPGLHVLSNAYLDTPWPKTERARERFASLGEVPPSSADVFALLHDQTRATPETVQQTGLPLEIELALSSIFIAVPGYGTRASSFVTVSRTGLVSFSERTYRKGKMHSEQSFAFSI